MIEIRKAEMNDAERLLQIYDYYVKNTAITFEYETPSLEAFKTRMVNTMSRYIFLVIEKDGRIEGYAYAGVFKDRAAYDWSCETTIYLDRDQRKSGLGRMLYETLEKELKEMGRAGWIFSKIKSIGLSEGTLCLRVNLQRLNI